MRVYITRHPKESLTVRLAKVTSVIHWHNSPKKHSHRFVVCGDFNRLDMTTISKVFNLTNIVNFPTREDAFLDQIYTNVEDLRTVECDKLSPLGSSDHCSVYMPSTLMTREDNSIYNVLSTGIVCYMAYVHVF